LSPSTKSSSQPRSQPTAKAFEASLDVEQGAGNAADQHRAEHDKHRCRGSNSCDQPG